MTSRWLGGNAIGRLLSGTLASAEEGRDVRLRGMRVAFGTVDVRGRDWGGGGEGELE